jgi:Domain of unknown function (DUF4397)
MKRERRLRGWGASSLVVLAIVFGFSSCQKNDNAGNEQIPAAGLMAFNLTPDKQAIGITLSGNAINQVPLYFTSYTGRYVSIYPGTRTAQAVDYSTQTAFTSSDFNFEQDKYYSLFVVGTDTSFSNLIVEDNFDSLSGTPQRAYVRFVNAINDSASPVLKVTSGSQLIMDQTTAFKTVSPFTAVNPGALSININNTGTISQSRDIEVEGQKAYTVLLLGKPGSTNPDQSVQIRFIENGRLTDSTGGN